MPIDLSGILLITDVDGTLLNDSGKITEGNLSAIKSFMEMGGNYTIATGRGITMAAPIAEALDINYPAVIFNGAAVHSFSSDKRLWSSSLNPETKAYLKLIMENFPTAAMEILRNDTVYLIATNDLEEQHLILGNVTPVRCSLASVPTDNWLKVLIVDEPGRVDKIIEFTKEYCRSHVHWVRSSPYYYEMLPEGINKGSGLRKLLETGENKFVIAVGDFMNDIELLEYADIGIAVENAEPSVKAAADMIVCDNNHDAIREVINYIIKNGGKNGYRAEKAVTNHSN